MMRTGGQALVESLVREGVESVFALPGVQLDWAFDALYEQREQIRVYHTRHEQATSYMADGYARTSGRDVVFLDPAPEHRQDADPELLSLAAATLRRAERPVIYSGGGTLAAGAWPELRALAELLEAPVVMSVDGRGAMSDRDDLAHTGLS